MKYALIAAAVLLASGCSGDGEASESAPPSPTPVVSLQTTCDRLFSQGPGEMGLWGRTTNFVTVAANEGRWDDAEAQAVHEQLAEVAGSADPSIRPHVEGMARAVSSQDALDVSAYKTAGTEVANQCAEYVAL